MKVIIRQLLHGLEVMHKRNILHRDIKLSNIYLVDRQSLQICLGDFGLSCIIDPTGDQKLFDACGTPGYVDPQVFIGEAPFSSKSDIFSLGCLLFKTLIGINIFSGETKEKIIISNCNENPHISILACAQQGLISESCCNLLLQMTKKRQADRPSAQQCL